MNYSKPITAILFLTLLVLSGCGGKPMTSLLNEKDSKAAATIFEQIQDRDAGCSCCLETDIIISLDTPIEKRAIDGYLHLMNPFIIKYIITNPFGQPLFVVVSNGKTFESINTFKRQFMSGSLRSLFLYHNVPTSMFFFNWGAYLTGRLQRDSWELEEIRNDRDDRGIWFTLRLLSGNKKRKNHLLIDTLEKKLLTRIIVDEHPKIQEVLENDNEPVFEDKIVAVINYSNWVKESGCLLPTKLNMTGFAFNSEIAIKLSNISIYSKQKQKRFKIKPPAGYYLQYLP